MQKLSGPPEHEGLFLPSDISRTGGDIADAPPRSRQTSWADVPWRTIIGTVGVVVATYALLMMVLAATRIITWVLIAAFMAIVLAPLVTFALPVVAMVAFWWEDWPGTRLRASWSGWGDTVLIAFAAVVLTGIGQAIAGHLDLHGIFDPTPGPGHVPTFPDTRPGTPRMPAGQLRYWSLCENDPSTQRFIGCLNDDRTVVRILGMKVLKPWASR